MKIECFKKGGLSIVSYAAEDQAKGGLKMAFGFNAWRPLVTLAKALSARGGEISES